MKKKTRNSEKIVRKLTALNLDYPYVMNELLKEYGNKLNTELVNILKKRRNDKRRKTRT